MEKNIRKIMEQYDIRTVKSLGQNFLISSQVQKKIIEAAAIQGDDLIIEIGAGLGVLSKEIANRAGRFVAIEIDKHLIPVLEEELKGYKNVKIINEDVLKLDIQNDIIRRTINDEEGFMPAAVKVVGNLPYYITTPIIMNLLEYDLKIHNDMEISGDTEIGKNLKINEIIFMVQKEVAERIVAKPGTKDYSALSVAVQYYTRPEILFNVSPSSFMPKPKVYSSVIRLSIYKTPPIKVFDKDLFFKVIRASFEQRRKTLVNALFNANLCTFNKEEIKSLLKNMEINENARGETLSLFQFAQLSNEIFQKEQKDC